MLPIQYLAFGVCLVFTFTLGLFCGMFFAFYLTER